MIFISPIMLHYAKIKHMLFSDLKEYLYFLDFVQQSNNPLAFHVANFWSFIIIILGYLYILFFAAFMLLNSSLLILLRIILLLSFVASQIFFKKMSFIMIGFVYVYSYCSCSWKIVLFLVSFHIPHFFSVTCFNTGFVLKQFYYF